MLCHRSEHSPRCRRGNSHAEGGAARPRGRVPVAAEGMLRADQHAADAGLHVHGAGPATFGTGERREPREAPRSRRRPGRRGPPRRAADPASGRSARPRDGTGPRRAGPRASAGRVRSADGGGAAALDTLGRAAVPARRDDGHGTLLLLASCSSRVRSRWSGPLSADGALLLAGRAGLDGGGRSSSVSRK